MNKPQVLAVLAVMTCLCLMSCGSDDLTGADVLVSQDAKDDPGPQLASGSKLLRPNEDVPTSEDPWFVWPGNETDHWSLIDESYPWDDKFVHTNEIYRVDRFAFTDLNEPSAIGVSEISFSFMLDAEIRDNPMVELGMRFYANGVEKGSASKWWYNDFYGIWTFTFENPGLDGDDVDDLEVEVEMLYQQFSSIAILSMWVDVDWFSGGKPGPNPHQDP